MRGEKGKKREGTVEELQGSRGGEGRLWIYRFGARIDLD